MSMMTVRDVVALASALPFDCSGCSGTWPMIGNIMCRLFEKGYIADPRNKAKSVLLTAEGRARSSELFHQHFASEQRVEGEAVSPKPRRGGNPGPGKMVGDVYRLGT